MITSGEVSFVKELIYELASIADPSEYIEGEVKDAYTILDKLQQYDTEKLMFIYQQLQSLQDHNTIEYGN
jgi:hypothetical protein